MSASVITAIAGAVCTILSSVVTFFLTKRKYNIEVDSQQIKNISESFDVYKKMNEDILEAQNKRIETLERENEALRLQVNQLQEQIGVLLMKKISTGTTRKAKNK